jgi:AcrR family transcriptional regulator
VAQRRELLLELGLRLFGSKPYDEISIEEIAQLAGMSKGLLYHYFPSKRDFYVACLRQASRQLSQEIKPDRSLPPAEQVRTSLTAYLDHVKANPAKSEALLRGGIGADPEVIEVVERTRQVIWEFMMAGMAATEEERLLRSAVRGWQRFVEVIALDWARSDGMDQDAVVELCLEVLRTAVRRSRMTS